MNRTLLEGNIWTNKWVRKKESMNSVTNEIEGECTRETLEINLREKTEREQNSESRNLFS